MTFKSLNSESEKWKFIALIAFCRSDAPDASAAANSEDPPIEAQVENGDVTSLQADQVDPSNDDPPPYETPAEENV